MPQLLNSQTPELSNSATAPPYSNPCAHHPHARLSTINHQLSTSRPKTLQSAQHPHSRSPLCMYRRLTTEKYEIQNPTLRVPIAGWTIPDLTQHVCLFRCQMRVCLAERANSC